MPHRQINVGDSRYPRREPESSPTARCANNRLVFARPGSPGIRRHAILVANVGGTEKGQRDNGRLISGDREESAEIVLPAAWVSDQSEGRL